MTDYYRKGWNDRANNRPINFKLYDKWSSEDQLSYELGRRDAACAQSANVRRKTPPVTTLVLPLQVQLMLAIEKWFKPNPR